jgi:HNH endonuclease
MAAPDDTTPAPLSPEERLARRRQIGRESARRRRAADPERIRGHKARYRAAHPERQRAYDHQRYWADPEKARRRVREYYAQHQEQCIATTRAWEATHRAQIRIADRRRYAAQPEKKRARTRRYKEEHPELVKLLKVAYKNRRRARQVNALHNDLTAAQWQEVLEAFGFRCAYCHRKMARLSQDHITPFAHQGSHTLHNVVPACPSCNSKKHAGPVLSPVQPLLLTVAPPQKKKRP